MSARTLVTLTAALGLAGTLGHGAVALDLAEAFSRLTGSAEWQRIDAVPLAADTHHPQGLVKLGDSFYLSTVEIIEPTVRYDAPRDGLDRSAGKGVGKLLKFASDGKLLGEVTLGEGDIYHPGGIDFDGRSILVPVAEYRPNSAAIIYRVDPETLKPTEILRFADHIGGVTLDRSTNRLHGVSWGSRRFYDWQLDTAGQPVSDKAEPVANPSFYIDYQDCHYAGPERMLCGGLNKYSPDGTSSFALGGLDLVDLARNAPVHQLPVKLWIRPDLVMTNNPQFCEASDAAIDCYFAPEDDKTTLYHYRADLPKSM